MNASKLNLVKPILESKDNIHLSIYASQSSNLSWIQEQLAEAQSGTEQHLRLILDSEELEKFVEPLVQLRKDRELLRRIRGNLAVFRTPTDFRILSLPIDVSPISVVASSYHVKPLLRWLREDRDYLLLGIGAREAHLFRGSLHAFVHLDSMLLEFQKLAKPRDWMSALANWVREHATDHRPPLFVCAEHSIFLQTCEVMRSSSLPRKVGIGEFRINRLRSLRSEIREILSAEMHAEVQVVLREYELAYELNFASHNIFQIARSAVAGKVKKLIVADGINIFGQIDSKTGGLSIHPGDLNAEDDDLLDDLAQLVLSKAGEVIVVPFNEIPKARPILAVMKAPASAAVWERFENPSLSLSS